MIRRGKPSIIVRFLLLFASFSIGVIAAFLFISSALSGILPESVAGKQADYQQTIATPLSSLSTVAIIIAGFLLLSAAISRFGLPTRILAAALSLWYAVTALPVFIALNSTKGTVSDSRLIPVIALTTIIFASFLPIWLGSTNRATSQPVENEQEDTYSPAGIYPVAERTKIGQRLQEKIRSTSPSAPFTPRRNV